MAMVILTNQQKETLRSFTDFGEECKWGILNKAAYWTGLDGTTVPNNDRILWAKSRSYGAAVSFNPAQINPDQNTVMIDRFLIYVKNIACVNDQQTFDPAVVTAYLVANNHFESMADRWFTDQIATVIF